MKTISFLVLLTLMTTSVQSDMTKLNGTYYSVKNEFERWSIMELHDNGTFEYKYGVSACQSEITGTYSVEKNLIQFKNDRKFTEEYLKLERDSLVKLDSTFTNIGISFYPDLSSNKWKIKNNSIRPISKIDCGCLTVNESHKKR